MPFSEVVRFLAALAMAASGLYFAAQGWRLVPPAREALSEFRMVPRDFGVVMERSGAARGHGGGTFMTDSIVVYAPRHGRVELRPPHRIVLLYFGGIRNDTALIMLADPGAGLIYQVTGDNSVYVGYNEASAIATERDDRLRICDLPSVRRGRRRAQRVAEGNHDMSWVVRWPVSVMRVTPHPQQEGRHVRIYRNGVQIGGEDRR